MGAYNNKNYYIDIVEAKPASAITIVETDCEVDSAPPGDYKEPERAPSKPAPFPSTTVSQVGDKYINGVIIPDTRVSNRPTGRDRPQNRRRDSMPIERRDVQTSRDPLPSLGGRDTIQGNSVQGDQWDFRPTESRDSMQGGQKVYRPMDGRAPMSGDGQDHRPLVDSRGPLLGNRPDYTGNLWMQGVQCQDFDKITDHLWMQGVQCRDTDKTTGHLPMQGAHCLETNKTTGHLWMQEVRCQDTDKTTGHLWMKEARCQECDQITGHLWIQEAQCREASQTTVHLWKEEGVGCQVTVKTTCHQWKEEAQYQEGAEITYLLENQCKVNKETQWEYKAKIQCVLYYPRLNALSNSRQVLV